MPAGLALSGQRLYVTEAGINAVAVVDTHTAQVLGHIAAGWFPTAAAVAADGKSLYVVNTKGKGSGPNGGDNFISPIPAAMSASLSSAAYPWCPSRTNRNWRQARRAWSPTIDPALLPDKPLPLLHHVFLIIPVNRTYDEILGDLPRADGDPEAGALGHERVAGEHGAGSNHCGYTQRPRVRATLWYQ